MEAVFRALCSEGFPSNSQGKMGHSLFGQCSNPCLSEESRGRPDQIITAEWSIVTEFLRPVWEAWGKPLIDLFATRFNAQLPMFVSPFMDPLAWKIDAMSFSWKSLFLYAFPPFGMIQQILAKWCQDRPRLILIAPRWPQRPWFPDLQAFTHTQTIKLNLNPNALKQSRTKLNHANPSSLDLTAWLLCEANCSHEISHNNPSI